MKITRKQYDILRGLAMCGHTYVSASEYSEVPFLSENVLVDTWMTMGGFPAWRITDKGREVLKENETRTFVG